MKNRITLIAILIAVLFIGGWTMQKTTQFEYKIENGHLSEKKLNEIASQGWELVAIDPASQYVSAPEFIFKRSK